MFTLLQVRDDAYSLQRPLDIRYGILPSHDEKIVKIVNIYEDVSEFSQQFFDEHAVAYGR